MKIEEIDRQIGMPDVEEEWTKFHREVIAPSPSLPHAQPVSRGSWRRAAVIALVCSLGFVALASVLYVGFYRPAPAAPAPDVAVDGVAPAAAQPTDEAIDNCFVFDNVELQAIVDALASYYGVEPCFLSSASRHIRLYVTLDKSMTLSEVVECLDNLQGVDMSLEGKTLLVR